MNYRSGYFNFFHDYMRQAVQSCYLNTTEKVFKRREQLSLYFSKANIDPKRKYEEVPYQLELIHNYSDLSKFITKLDHFNALFNESEHKFDLYRYWRVSSNFNPGITVVVLNYFFRSTIDKQFVVIK